MVDSGAPNVGSNVTFTIQVINTGPSAATGVAVTDLLPIGLAFVSATPSLGSYISGTGMWSVGNLASGGSATLQVVATVTQPGTITNSASISGSSPPDPNTINNSASASVGGQQADLAVVKSVNNATPNVGTNVTFTIQVTNNGTSTATGVAVTDTLPAGLIFVLATPSQGSYTSGTGVWTIGSLANGASVTLQMVATVTQAGAITNSASISATNQPDQNSANNSGSAAVSGQQADLAMTKSVNNVAPNVGATVTFTIRVTNNGPSTATGVAVTELLPVGLTFVSASASQGAYTSTTGVWSVGSLTNGASATLQVIVTVTQPGAISNSASVTLSNVPDPTPGNNTSTSTITGQAADLTVNKVVNGASPGAGNPVIYTITVHNSGPNNATGVAAIDVLPAGLTFVLADPSQGTYTSSTGLWMLGSLANGVSATLRIQVIVTGTGSIINTAQISASDQYDPNSAPANNNTNENDQSQVIISAQPTAITLASFTATHEGNVITVRWVTTAEINTWGFHLYRSVTGRRADAVRVTSQIILGQGRGQGGAVYQWTDMDIQTASTYSYWLQEIEISGANNEYGPARAAPAITATYHIMLPLIYR
jgi:uncharacterized repeat protein (TIGR01451 family)